MSGSHRQETNWSTPSTGRRMQVCYLYYYYLFSHLNFFKVLPHSLPTLFLLSLSLPSFSLLLTGPSFCFSLVPSLSSYSLSYIPLPSLHSPSFSLLSPRSVSLLFPHSLPTLFLISLSLPFILPPSLYCPLVLSLPCSLTLFLLSFLYPSPFPSFSLLLFTVPSFCLSLIRSISFYSLSFIPLPSLHSPSFSSLSPRSVSPLFPHSLPTLFLISLSLPSFTFLLTVPSFCLSLVPSLSSYSLSYIPLPPLHSPSFSSLSPRSVSPLFPHSLPTLFLLSLSLPSFSLLLTGPSFCFSLVPSLSSYSLSYIPLPSLHSPSFSLLSPRSVSPLFPHSLPTLFLISLSLPFILPPSLHCPLVLSLPYSFNFFLLSFFYPSPFPSFSLLLFTVPSFCLSLVPSLSSYSLSYIPLPPFIHLPSHCPLVLSLPCSLTLFLLSFLYPSPSPSFSLLLFTVPSFCLSLVPSLSSYSLSFIPLPSLHSPSFSSLSPCSVSLLFPHSLPTFFLLSFSLPSFALLLTVPSFCLSLVPSLSSYSLSFIPSLPFILPPSLHCPLVLSLPCSLTLFLLSFLHPSPFPSFSLLLFIFLFVSPSPLPPTLVSLELTTTRYSKSLRDSTEATPTTGHLS